MWGRNDPFFLPAGAGAFKRDLPDADIRFVDTGHFALGPWGRSTGARPHLRGKLAPAANGRRRGSVSVPVWG